MLGGKNRVYFIFIFLIIFASCNIPTVSYVHAQNAKTQDSLNVAFDQASKEFHVPVEILKTICYMEGRLSNHQGYPSVDRGYGCMHLVKNNRVDTLDTAALLIQ